MQHNNKLPISCGGKGTTASQLYLAGKRDISLGFSKSRSQSRGREMEKVRRLSAELALFSEGYPTEFTYRDCEYRHAHW